MAAMGYCPSGRLFEAAACGVPVLTDAWEGVNEFFRPGEEILVARDAEEAAGAISREPSDLARIGRAARERALQMHTAERRTEELLARIGG
jgi:spore maturation protein CgeB